ncbi:N-acetylated-alpha-linked acidic dipeptidase 2 [Phytophthora nicotianae]|uniref:N-acetylated-alpha-linked acidic dipeptidase 2 n=1 Tax=Phytophthora nicotianae TaxID=4792 RepID=A0A0W8CWK7_PHYNI|nr:N-acetylated-alpha-linked acidic dipeptidase 2 [Phytophthora nicotianae]
MAAQFIVVGGAVNAIAACEPGQPHQCSEFWDSIFDTLQREADGVSSKCDTPLRRKERQASVAELEELIQVAVQVFEKDGAQTLQQSFADHQEENGGHEDALARQRKSSARSSLGADADAAPIKAIVSPLPSPRTPANGECNLMEETAEQGGATHRDSAEISGVTERDEDSDSDEPDDTGIPAPLTTEVNETAMYGIFSHDSANFASQVLRYFAIRGQKGACILHFLAEHPATVDMLLANIGHDDIRTLLLHLIYAEHSEAAITSLFETHMMQKLIQKQVTFSPPRNAFERDCIENTFMLLREIVHAPYLTGRGVAISAKTIPLDKVTGQDEYVSICGASRETANSALRKYTSRKWKWIVPLSVRSRYTHGQDETHTSVGHHGLYITAYDHQQSDEDSKVSAKEMHFSVTKLEDRDLWKDLLSNAADTIQKMARDYSVLSQKLKKPDKKTVTHCQDPTCNTPFKLFRRPHSCKRCGKWMCAKCTSQRMSIPEVGLLHPVRHCRACFEENGGAHAETEPFNLFHLKDAKRNCSSNGVGANVAASLGSQNGTLSNAELYELAHGMVSPRTLMQMNRRLTRVSSIDSPTGGENGGFHADEINAPGSLGAENLSSFADDEDDFSPFSSSVSRRSLLNPREDIRG